MKKFKDYISVPNQEEEEFIEEKEENEVKTSFFGRHKKGIIIGGIAGLGVGLATLLVKKSHNDEDYDDEEGFYEESESDDASDDQNENEYEK